MLDYQQLMNMSRIAFKVVAPPDMSKMTPHYRSGYDATRPRLTLLKEHGKLL